MGSGDGADALGSGLTVGMYLVTVTLVLVVAASSVASVVGFQSAPASAQPSDVAADTADAQLTSHGRPVDGTLGGTINLSDANTTLRGESVGDGAGWSLASGDVNGDGQTDVLVGAPFNNSSVGAETGAVYLFYGPVESGDVNLSRANATFTGVKPGDWAGFSVAAGDVNDDGRDDVVVGAPLVDGPTTNNTGAAYVVHGRNLSGDYSLASANATLLGVGTGDLAGRSVAVVPTVSGGPGEDVLVGAPLNNKAGLQAGTVYLFANESLSGSLSLADANATFTGEAADDNAGWSVSSAGDVNGDGWTDIVIGAIGNNTTTGANAGAAYVVFGGGLTGDQSLAAADAKLSGVGDGDNAGWSVSDAGDVNGDGYGDVVVGAPFNNSTATNAGAAYVVYGAGTLSNSSLVDANVTLTGEGVGDAAGWAVSSAGSGDITCDRFADVLVGAPRNDSTAPSAGAAYLVAGGRHLAGERNLGSAEAKLQGEGEGDLAGIAVEDGNDTSGDYLEDALVGAPGTGTAAPRTSSKGGVRS
ncbi:integrin alpha [Halobacteriaceae archaeon GCM10025711]